MNINTTKLQTPAPKPSVTSIPQPTQNSYTVELPSKGKLYDGKATVELSFFTLGDVKRLYDISNGIKSDSMEKLIASKVHDFPLEELAVCDYIYLLYWLRINSFTSHPMEVSWTCNKNACGLKNLTKVTTECVIQQEIDPDYTEPATIDLPDFGIIQVRQERVKDDREVDMVLDLLIGNTKTEGDEWLCKLAATWVDNRPLIDRYKDVRSKFSADDVHALDSFKREYAFGVKEQLNVKCYGCQEVSQKYFRLSIRSFLPSMEDSGSVRTRVRFGSTSKSAVSNVG